VSLLVPFASGSIHWMPPFGRRWIPGLNLEGECISVVVLDIPDTVNQFRIKVEMSQVLHVAIFPDPHLSVCSCLRYRPITDYCEPNATCIVELL
jgi:hypothetical protein